MAKYNYEEAVTDDLKEELEEFIKNHPQAVRSERSFERFLDYVQDSDSVTGNMTGSYYCDTWKAEEALSHNIDLYMEAADYYDIKELKDAESMDVIIRLYLCDTLAHQVWEEYWDDREEEEEEEDETEEEEE